MAASKWFRKDEDDDDDEEEEFDKSDDDSDDEFDDKQNQGEQKRSKWLIGRDADEKEEDEKKTKIVSKKAKVDIELKKAKHELKNALKISDFSAAIDHLDRLVKQVEKRTEGPPKMFFSAVCLALHYLPEDKKNLTAVQLKAYGPLKQKIKKATAKYELDFAEFQKNWTEEGDVTEDEDNQEDDSKVETEESIRAPLTAKQKAKEEEDQREWKPDMIDKKLQELVLQRGKRGTDRSEMVAQLNRILSHTPSSMPAKRIELYIHLISAYYDLTPSLATHMNAANWKSVYDTLNKVLDVLAANPNLVIIEAEDSINEPNQKEDPADAVKVHIMGNFNGFVDRLDDEFVRSLQFTDPHTTEYVTRFQDEGYLLDICERVYFYYSNRNMYKHAARVASRMLDHIYYRRQEDHVKMLQKQKTMCESKAKSRKKATEDQPDAEPAATGENEEPDSRNSLRTPASALPPAVTFALQQRKKRETVITEELADTINKLVNVILKHGDDKLRIRALLCHIYNLALHGKFTQARDMLLMAHIHETIQLSNNATFQILFNRVLAQLGLAAFRNGLFKDTHMCLNDLTSTPRLRELLAQAVPMQRHQDRKPEQEKQDKMKLCPFHMHINVDVIEAVQLVSSMLLEVPAIAANPFDTKRKTQGKSFAKLLSNYTNQVFLGPPENTRDHVFAASNALTSGDWKTCLELIMGLQVWGMMPDGTDIKAMLTKRIKEEALRAYLFQFSRFYNTISLQQLADRFEVPPNHIHSVVSRMIFNEELSASWDQPAGCLVVNHTHPTKLQFLATRAADKAQQQVEFNERVLESRTTGFGGMSKGQDQKNQRPTDSLWGNMNRWGVLGRTRNTGGNTGQQSWFTNRKGGQGQGQGGFQQNQRGGYRRTVGQAHFT